MALVEPQVVPIGFSDLALHRDLVQPHVDRRKVAQITEMGNQPRLLLAQMSQACLLSDALAKGGDSRFQIHAEFLTTIVSMSQASSSRGAPELPPAARFRSWPGGSRAEA